MAEPTEADRELARRLWHNRDNATGALIPAIAQAIADERERARAPFLAVMVDLTEAARINVHQGAGVAGIALHSAVARIRRAAEENVRRSA